MDLYFVGENDCLRFGFLFLEIKSFRLVGDSCVDILARFIFLLSFLILWGGMRDSAVSVDYPGWSESCRTCREQLRFPSTALCIRNPPL